MSTPPLHSQIVCCRCSSGCFASWDTQAAHVSRFPFLVSRSRDRIQNRLRDEEYHRPGEKGGWKPPSPFPLELRHQVRGRDVERHARRECQTVAHQETHLIG